MPRLVREDESGVDGSDAILIVTGSSLAAEQFDRPVAYALRTEMVRTLGAGWERRVLVCSDLWYINHDRLRARPTVSIGSPEVSALSAYLADKLGTLDAIEDVLMVQGDEDEAVVSCWGVTHDATARAVAMFVEGDLGAFLTRARRS